MRRALTASTVIRGLTLRTPWARLIFIGSTTRAPNDSSGRPARRPAGLAVGRGATDRAVALTCGQGSRLADQEDGGSERCDCEEEDDDHGSSL